MQDSHDHADGQPEVADASAPRRTIDQLQADLRDPAKLDAALLAFESPAEPADMGRLLPEVENVLPWGANLLAAIQRVHQLGRLREDTYIPTGIGVASAITSEFPIAEVWDWSPVVKNGKPAIDVVIRFASDPIAPRVSVALTIGYSESVDGTENLVYRIRSIREEEAQDPQGN